MPDALTDPADMTPSERRQEIATILARGLLRIHQCAERSPAAGASRAPGKASESSRV